MPLCTGGLWGEEEKKDWQQLLAQVPIFKKKERAQLYNSGIKS